MQFKRITTEDGEEFFLNSKTGEKVKSYTEIYKVHDSVKTTATQTNREMGAKEYQGVGGWLLLLCLSLTVFNPLLTLITFLSSYDQTSGYFSMFPGLMLVTVIDTLLSLALMIFSVYAGTGLWTLRQGAVQTAKNCLLCYLGYYFISAILPYMAGLPLSANQAMFAETFMGVIRGVIYVSIWYSYLNKSVRVMNTYD
jgi:hypothetical protein